MPGRSEFQQLARLRLREARVLFDNALYDGCVYLCGYVVEFALKARICKLLRISAYPDKGDVGKLFKVHDFDRLKLLAGIEEEIDLNKNKALFDNWSIATKWRPEQRYDPPGKYNAASAGDVLRSIEEKPNGVLTWLTKRW